MRIKQAFSNVGAVFVWVATFLGLLLMLPAVRDGLDELAGFFGLNPVAVQAVAASSVVTLVIVAIYHAFRDGKVPEVARLSEKDVRNAENALKKAGLFDVFKRHASGMIEGFVYWHEMGDYETDTPRDLREAVPDLLLFNVVGLNAERQRTGHPHDLHRLLLTELGQRILKRLKLSGAFKAKEA